MNISKPLLSSLFIIILAISNASFAVDLMQRESKVTCSGFNSSEVIIIQDQNKTIINTKDYHQIKSLETALLSKSQNDYALFQATQNDEGYLITGKLYDFKKISDCSDSQGTNRLCSNESDLTLNWSSTKINIFNKKTSLNLDVIRYGIYPVDGTYFIAKEEESQNGAALIDFGSELKLLFGKIEAFKCRHEKI